MGEMARGLRFFLVFALLTASGFAQIVRFAAIGDSGTGDQNQRAVARQMEVFHQAQPWEFVLMLGDNIYENGEPANFQAHFKQIYRGLNVPFHATLGNHDRRTRKGLDQVQDEAFGYVGKKDEYVFEAGPTIEGKVLARFICLNSGAWKRGEELAKRKSRLDAWLAKSSGFHWNIVYFHHPIYSFAHTGWYGKPFRGWGHASDKKLRQYWERKFQNAGIDIVLSGHDHFYQKIKPQGGVHYFVSGAAGKIRNGIKANHPEVEFGDEKLHFVQFEVAPTEVRFQAVDEKGEIFHQGVIPK